MDHQHPPSPALFFDAINAHQRTSVIKAAIELDVFSEIGRANSTARQLAGACQTSERGMRILCDYLVVMGFLTKDRDNYSLTADAATFLDQRSPAYLGGCLDFLASPQLVDNFKDVTALVRKGGTTMSEEGALEPEHPIWVTFARAMAPMMIMPAQLLGHLINGDAAEPLQVLDIAAGHGMFGITIAQQNSQARIVALDWPNVLEVAQENAARAGVSERFSTIEGSAFEVDFGSRYDAVLLPNFLHHFDAATCEKLLAKVYAALAEGGRAAILEFIPNEDRVSPPIPATFAMMMLGSTPAGDVYTYSQLESMCRNAGFARREMHEMPPTPQRAVIAYR